jgi:hypothetical protein
MIAKEEAIKILNKEWGTNKWIFQADFHIPKNVTLREGTKPFGYFRNIRFNGEILEYPLETNATQEKRISIYQVLKNDLIDKETYEITLGLANDEHRKKNPYQLVVKSFRKIKQDSGSGYASLRQTISDIFNENININTPFQVVNLANSVESLATDIYSEDKRFIYELIQNADDAALDEDSEISIEIINNYVIISHNGAPFNSRDIRGLCSIGLGTKANDATKTGYKGIGFKSVFGQPDGIVYVKSEDTLFKFDREYARQRGWNPKWGNQSNWEKENGVIFQCPWQMMPILTDGVKDLKVDKALNNKNFTVKTAIKVKDDETVYENIKAFFSDAKFLLFLRRITVVGLVYKENKILLKKVKQTDNKEFVSLFKNDQLLSNWFVKNWVHNIPFEIQTELKADPKTPKKIQSMEKTEMSFALEVNEAFNQIKLLEEGSAPLYSYLPTTVKEYNLPFIVNCNFLLDASREKIHKNRKWNEWLFQVIGYKIVECCSELLKNDLFTTSYLSLFKNGFLQETDNLRVKINTGLKIGLDRFPIIKNRNNDPQKLYEIALDPFNLFQIDPNIPDFISRFLNESHKTNGLNGDNIITISESNEILKKLFPFEITEAHLQSFLSSPLINEILTLSTNYHILRLLYPLESNDNTGKWYSVVTNNKLIINEHGELDYIKRVCFPIEVDLSEYNEYKNTLIHHEIYLQIKNDVELRKWLEKLGVTEPSSIAYLEKEIIGDIHNCITNSNYIDITKFVFRLHQEKRLSESHYIHLQELPVKTNKGFKKAHRCVISTIYNPTIDFKNTLYDEPYIVDDYLEISNTNEVKRFFKCLQAKDDIEFIQTNKFISDELPSKYVETCYELAKDGHVYPHLIGVFYPNYPNSKQVPFYIQNFTFIEQTNHIEFAQIFWDRVFNKYIFYKIQNGVTPKNYSPGKEYSIYGLGNGLELSTLDDMAWGRMPSNKVKIPSFIFWYIQNVNCMPTNMGLKKPTETFVNSEAIIELVGDFLPVINIQSKVPENWSQFLSFKNKLTIEELLFVLNKISTLTSKKGYLDKENEKRLGLIYTELTLHLNHDHIATYKKIQQWAKSALLISSSKQCMKPSDLLYIKITGFKNNITGVNSILIPKNVEKHTPNFIDLLNAFSVRIIDDFGYYADIDKEIYDIKIKLLKLLGPICLLLKNKMIINDLDKSIYDRYKKISKTQFFFCKNIYPVFKYENESIKGDSLNYYYDANENKFFLSKDWKNPICLFEISYEISSLLTATKLEKEIMMLMGLTDKQISEYLNSLQLDAKEYSDLEIISSIQALINELENKTKSKGAENQINDVISDKDENIKKSEDVKIIEKSSPFDEAEISIFKRLFGRDLEDNELVEENLFAQVKALRYFKDQGYNISEAENQFQENYKDKFIYPIKDEYGNSIKVMCRSARKGILFLGAYAWNNLKETNTELFILTGNKSTDNLRMYNEHELEEQLKSYYKVIRRINTTVEDIQAIVDSESNLKNMQFLYQVKKGNYDIIFNPKQNKPGETDGSLTDIGVDDI